MIEGSRPDTLSAAREDALQAARAKNAFLSRISSELRASLNAILGFTQLLETSELSHDDRDAAAHIAAAGQRLLGLINDLIDTALIEAGELRLSVEPDTAAMWRCRPSPASARSSARSSSSRLATSPASAVRRSWPAGPGDVAGVRRITVHDARRTCASLLADLDVHPRVAMQILRHADFAITMEIYTQVSSKQTREALKRLGESLDR